MVYDKSVLISNSTLSKFKIVIIGDGNVGKTSLVKKLTNETFNNNYIPTLGVQVTNFDFMVDDKKISFNIWDCAGVKQYQGLADGYYIKADAFVFVIDMSDVETYHNLKKWVLKAKKYGNDIPFIIIGNKKDIAAKEYDDINNIYKISAKNDDNIGKPFYDLAKTLIKKYK